MVDPISLTNLSIAIATRLGSLINDIYGLKNKLDGAETTLASLNVQLMTLKAAIDNVDQWLQNQIPRNATMSETTVSAFKATLGGCNDYIESLTTHVKTLNPTGNHSLSFRGRVKAVLNDEFVKSTREQLQSQMQALTFLLTTASLPPSKGHSPCRHECRRIDHNEHTKSSTKIEASVSVTQTKSPTFPLPTIGHPEAEILAAYRRREEARKEADADLRRRRYQMEKVHLYNIRQSRAKETQVPRRQRAQISQRSGSPEARVRVSKETLRSLVEDDITLVEDSESTKSEQAHANDFSPQEATALSRRATSASGLLTNLQRGELLRAWQGEPRTLTILTVAITECRADAVATIIHTKKDELDMLLPATVSPLLLACTLNRLEILRHLLETGLNVNAHNGQYTAMHIAILRGDVPMIRLLLKYGAEIDTRDERGHTPLQLACQHGFQDIVELLVEHGAAVTTGKHEFAKDFSHNDRLSILIDAAINVGLLPAAGTHRSWSCLHVASNSGHSGIVQLLLQAGADTAATSNDGKTALHLACRGGHRRVVEMLLEHGAALNAMDKSMRTPLDVASRCSDVTLGQYLRDAGGKSFMKDDIIFGYLKSSLTSY